MKKITKLRKRKGETEIKEDEMVGDTLLKQVLATTAKVPI